jgi:hypothetical protein
MKRLVVIKANLSHGYLGAGGLGRGSIIHFYLILIR